MMQVYILKRVLLFPLTLFFASLVIFLVLRVLPGDVAHVILSSGGEATYTQEEYRALRQQLGLDRPLYAQYGSWLWDLLRLDLGTSFYFKTSVAEEIGRRFPLTLELAVIAWAFSLLVGVTLGVLMAVYQDTWLDYLLRIISISGVTMPAYWTGSLIILVLVAVFGWLPPLGAVPLWKDPIKNIQQFTFPALAIGYLYAAIIARMTRSAMLEVLRQDYMRTAWAKGLPLFTGVRRHALKNALIPVVTISGYQFGHLMAGVLILEFLFAIPGLGRALFEGVRVRDYPMIQAVVMLTALVFLVSNLLVDISYAWLNPRIRYR